jgi:hypothetical protein
MRDSPVFTTLNSLEHTGWFGDILTLSLLKQAPSGSWREYTSFKENISPTFFPLLLSIEEGFCFYVRGK